MFNRAPKFKYEQIEDTDDPSRSDILLPERVDTVIELQQAAWKNLSLLLDIMGSASKFEKRLPSAKALQVIFLTLRNTDDYYSITVATRQICAISGEVAQERWDYLYYSDMRFADQAQVNITLQNPLTATFGAIEATNTVSMQRFMDVNDHKYVGMLLQDVQQAQQKAKNPLNWDDKP